MVPRSPPLWPHPLDDPPPHHSFKKASLKLSNIADSKGQLQTEPYSSGGDQSLGHMLHDCLHIPTHWLLSVSRYLDLILTVLL